MLYDDYVSRFRAGSGLDDAAWAFVRHAASGDFGTFRRALGLLGWPCLPLHDGFIASELLLDIWSVRYPFFSRELEGRGPSDVSFLDVPAGWLERVVLPLCEDIRELALGFDASGRVLCAYALDQVKEKFGTLRWYGRLDGVDDDLSDVASDFLSAVDVAVCVAETISGQICADCGSSRDVFFHAQGWHHSSCVRCDCARLGRDTDIDSILSEAGLTRWPYIGDSMAAAWRLSCDAGGRSWSARSRILDNLTVERFSPDGTTSVTDVCRRADELGVSNLMRVVRELDGSLGDDVLEVLSREAVVSLAQAGR